MRQRGSENVRKVRCTTPSVADGGDGRVHLLHPVHEGRRVLRLRYLHGVVAQVAAEAGRGVPGSQLPFQYVQNRLRRGLARRYKQADRLATEDACWILYVYPMQQMLINPDYEGLVLTRQGDFRIPIEKLIYKGSGS